jgi:tRNA(Arg) A34 adenosine deaminase TadA
VTRDETLIRAAIGLAKAARSKGNHPLGALLAAGDRILVEAGNTAVTGTDPTRHAELNLLQAAWATLDSTTIRDSTLYTSTELCPMCAGAIYYSKVSRVVFSVSQEVLSSLSGGAGSKPSLLRLPGCGVRLEGPLLADEGLEAHAGFWR